MSCVLKDHIDLLFDDIILNPSLLNVSCEPMTFLGLGEQVIKTERISAEKLFGSEVAE